MWQKRIAIILTLVMVWLVPAGMAQAQNPVPGPLRLNDSDPFWRAWYYNNTTLSGNPVLYREEANITYDWGVGSPDASVPADRFSVRWTRYIYENPGWFRFSALVDDGIRLYVDGRLLIDQWRDQGATLYTADVYLTTGHHLVVVEYYENVGAAVAKVSYAPAPPPIVNWKGEYFNNPTLSGAPALIRDDANINFNWGTGSPVPGTIGADYFSVRWTRDLNLQAGWYRFSAMVDDGVRLWVNNHLLIDQWIVQSARTHVGEIYLPGGAVPIKMEYYDNAGHAVAQLSWTRSDAPSGPTPAPVEGTVIVDDTDPGFVRGGASGGWRAAQEGYNGRLIWTRNNDWAREGYNWARWYPTLKAGQRYEVFVFIPERYTTTSSAQYWISHYDGFTMVPVNQSANGNRWVSLGTYRFRGTSADYVSLNDVTGETRLTRLIAFDAVKWEPR